LTYANQDDDSLEMIVNSLVTFYHTTFLSVCVAVLGTDATNYVCVALDFLCNLLLLYIQVKNSTFKYVEVQARHKVHQRATII